MANTSNLASILRGLFRVGDDDFREECGMDFLCFDRILKMGCRIAVAGMLNALWLLPLYATAVESDETDDIVDGIVEVTIGNIPSGSKRLLGTVLASYIFFGYVMYLILQEFEWFFRQRHAFLVQPKPRNYAVFVRNVPPEYLDSSRAVADFFQCNTSSLVLDARLRLKVPGLSKLVSKRDALVQKLEHDLAFEYYRNITASANSRQCGNRRPRHQRRQQQVYSDGGVDSNSRHNNNSSFLASVVGNRTNTLDESVLELVELNREISDRIDRIMRDQRQSHQLYVDLEAVIDASAPANHSNSNYRRRQQRRPLPGNDVPLEEDPARPSSGETEDTSMEESSLVPQREATLNDRADNAEEGSNLFEPMSQTFKGLASLPMAAASTAMSLVAGGGPGDGIPYDAGFVTFSKLSAVHSTLQMVQHEKPFAMEVLEAPDPDDGTFHCW